MHPGQGEEETWREGASGSPHSGTRGNAGAAPAWTRSTMTRPTGAVSFCCYRGGVVRRSRTGATPAVMHAPVEGESCNRQPRTAARRARHASRPGRVATVPGRESSPCCNRSRSPRAASSSYMGSPIGTAICRHHEFPRFSCNRALAGRYWTKRTRHAGFCAAFESTNRDSRFGRASEALGKTPSRRSWPPCLGSHLGRVATIYPIKFKEA